MSESPLSVRACFYLGHRFIDYVPASWQISWHWQCLSTYLISLFITKQDARFKALFSQMLTIWK